MSNSHLLGFQFWYRLALLGIRSEIVRDVERDAIVFLGRRGHMSVSTNLLLRAYRADGERTIATIEEVVLRAS